MSMKVICLSALVVCGVAATALAAQNPMRAGRWEVTTQLEMPGSPMKLPEMKTMQCVTPDQLKDPAGALPNAAPGCKVSDYKTTGNSVSWKMACTAPQNMSGSGALTFNGDTYTGTIQATTPQGAMTMKLSGKRVGDCTAP
jgi:hypothetical protein